jgi:CHASE2 domain-containing sensor protein
LIISQTVLVGLTDYQEVTSIVKKAIELDRIIRANRLQNPLPLPIDRSIAWELVWILSWSALAGRVMWDRKRKLLLPLVIVSQSVIAVGFIICGHGVPIVVSSIAIILVGGAIYTIEHLSLDRPA